MAFPSPIRKWLGEATTRGKKNKNLRETASKTPEFFYQEWTRRAVPQTGGQNYQLSSHQLPRYDIAGPLPFIATPYHSANPAPAKDQRNYPTNSAGGAGIAHGTMRTQSLYNPDAGGFTRDPFAHVASPYDIFNIKPAGVA